MILPSHFVKRELAVLPVEGLVRHARSDLPTGTIRHQILAHGSDSDDGPEHPRTYEVVRPASLPSLEVELRAPNSGRLWLLPSGSDQVHDMSPPGA